MTTKYLDSTGLSYLWGKIKEKFQEKLVSGTNIKTINNTSLLGSGNISISGGGGISTSDFDVVTHDATAQTVAATTDSGSKSLTLSKSGYIPLGIVGWYVSGTNHMHQNMYQCYLSARATGSATVAYRFRNLASVQVSVTWHFVVLWVKA